MTIFSRAISSICYSVTLALGFVTAAIAGQINGFDTQSQVLDETTLVRVGPVDFPTPSLDKIKLETATDTNWDEGDFVMGVALNGEARAYPLPMMVWHQVANNELGGVPILVTFCRMCGTGVVYDRVVDNQTLSFSMSGLIYRADILLYDRETRSLWSRFLDESVAGPSAGKPIFGLPHHISTLGEWLEQFPESTIVSRDTGFDIDYSKAPMGGGTAGDEVFSTLPRELRYHPAMPVIGIRRNGETRAYPAGEILLMGGAIEDNFNGLPVTLSYQSTSQAFEENFDSSVDYDVTVWRKWSMQHPESSIFEAWGRTKQ